MWQNWGGLGPVIWRLTFRRTANEDMQFHHVAFVQIAREVRVRDCKKQQAMVPKT